MVRRSWVRSPRPLPTAWVAVGIVSPAEADVIVSPLRLCMAERILSDVNLGTHPRDNLVAGEDVKKSKQTNKQTGTLLQQ